MTLTMTHRSRHKHELGAVRAKGDNAEAREDVRLEVLDELERDDGLVALETTVEALDVAEPHLSLQRLPAGCRRRCLDRLHGCGHHARVLVHTREALHVSCALWVARAVGSLIA